MGTRKFLFLFLLFFIFAACSSDDDGDEKNLTEDEIFDHYFDQRPDLSNCYQGVLKDARKKETLDYVNHVRSLHNLPSVSYDFDSDLQTQKAALMGLANGEITHTPQPSSKCYSNDGADGCLSSNLGIIGHSAYYPTNTDEDLIAGFMKEKNSESIGHRRWILFPFLKYISYGRVIGKNEDVGFFITTCALKVIYNETQNVNVSGIPFIAYPYNNYPSKLFDANCFLSFSVVLDRSKMNEIINYTSATIDVNIKSTNEKMTVSEKSYNSNDGVGIPNSIQWKVAGLKKDILYTVSIDNVFVEGVKKDFQYEFKIVD